MSPSSPSPNPNVDNNTSDGYDAATKSNNSADENDNVRALKALQRLSEVLKVELNDQQSAPHLSHYRLLPELVLAAYQMMKEGSQLVYSTSTKYTLVGKIDVVEGAKIASDLRQGCELVATGAMMICCDDSLGMCRSARKYAKMGVRSMVGATLQLIQYFCDHGQTTISAVTTTTVDKVVVDEQNDVASQKTGVVWESCQTILQMPQGNRNAMRRDLFQWTLECNESMEEFQNVIDLGSTRQQLESIQECIDDNETNTTAAGACSGPNEENATTTTWDDFCEGTDDERYTSLELPIAVACVSIIKISRGCMNLTLQASDQAGAHIDERLLAKNGNNDKSHVSGDDNASKEEEGNVLQWISKLHDLARAVGDGMTDFASLLYPPLEYDELRNEVNRQVDCIVQLIGHVLSSTENQTTETNGQLCIIQLNQDVTDLAKRLQRAVTARREEALSSLEIASSTK